MRVHGTLLRLAVLALGLAGCAARQRAPTPDEPNPLQLSASLEVENSSTLDVRVYVVRGGMLTRLGMVTGLTTVRFELTPVMIRREIRLRAEPIGGFRELRSDALVVRPGQFVSWRLDDKLRTDRLSIW